MKEKEGDRDDYHFLVFENYNGKSRNSLVKRGCLICVC